MQKIFKTGAIFWEKAQCVCIVIKTATKRPFSLATPQLDEATYHIGTHITWSTKVWSFKWHVQSWVGVHGYRKHLSQLKGTTWQIRWWYWRAHHVHSKILIPLLSVTMPTDQTDYSSPLVASVMQQIWIFNRYYQASQAVLHIVYKYEFSSQKTAISTIKPTRQCSAVCSSVNLFFVQWAKKPGHFLDSPFPGLSKSAL